MARDIDKRLQSLRSRRTGLDRTSRVASDSAIEIIAKSLINESYQKRAPVQKYTQYAIGAMQEVDAEYTRISYGEADRVWRQLNSGLEKEGVSVISRIQGSVACNVHIRGVSDIDVLVIDDRYIRYSTTGWKANNGYYNSPVSYDTLQALVALRKSSETILGNAFPAATVDKFGAKAISISGGSLRRPVDIVPSNWFDTEEYQRSGDEADRGVEILDKYKPERIKNRPFKHIQLLNLGDAASSGGLKKAIRLCKNVKADAIEEGTQIDLSSFDIASTLWHADRAALTVGVANELAILAEATRHLDDLSRRPDYARTLTVPDGSRVIFDTDKKQEALLLLSLELDDLSERVSREQTRSQAYVPLTKQRILEDLKKAYIPA